MTLLTALAGGVMLSGPTEAAPPAEPEKLELVGVLRDFRETGTRNGHPDFEVVPKGGYGHYVGNIAPELDEAGKPVFVGGGFKVDKQWIDAAGRSISHRLFNSGLGDSAGKQGQTSTGGIKSADSFAQWYRDVPGINMSMPLTLTFERQADGSYVFDDKTDPRYQALGGFFPLEDQLFGNPGGRPDRNFHFTYELHTDFAYDASADQIFKFIGDDDVWVFVDGKLVIDIGGVHAAVEQFVEIDRLGLVDGERYSLDFFFAERHRTQSNFRIVTNIPLSNVRYPTVTAQYD